MGAVRLHPKEQQIASCNRMEHPKDLQRVKMAHPKDLGSSLPARKVQARFRL